MRDNQGNKLLKPWVFKSIIVYRLIKQPKADVPVLDAWMFGFWGRWGKSGWKKTSWKISTRGHWQWTGVFWRDTSRHDMWKTMALRAFQCRLAMFDERHRFINIPRLFLFFWLFWLLGLCNISYRSVSNGGAKLQLHLFAFVCICVFW